MRDKSQKLAADDKSRKLAAGDAESPSGVVDKLDRRHGTTTRSARTVCLRAIKSRTRQHHTRKHSGGPMSGPIPCREPSRFCPKASSEARRGRSIPGQAGERQSKAV